MVIEPCPHCDMELDGGDIYTTLKNNTLYQDKTDEDVIKIAQTYGWTKHNKKRFSKMIIVQPLDRGSSHVKCPYCDSKLLSR
jgi:hypothetical protein